MGAPKGACFTYHYKKGLSPVLLSEAEIENNADLSKKIKIQKALWDTGATKSLITPNIAQTLGLKPVSKVTVSTPSGQHISDMYVVNLRLPNGVYVPGLQVLQGFPANCDMLIGMDIIGLGDFAVSSGKGNTLFSFRYPSMAEIDFCKDSYMLPEVNSSKIGRNDLCSCGSGKKYKKCCGR